MVNTEQNLLIMLNNLQQMHSKLLQNERFKKQQKQLVIWLFIKSLIKLQKSQKNSQQNNSETVTNEHNKGISKERYISPEERQKIIVDLGLI